MDLIQDILHELRIAIKAVEMSLRGQVYTLHMPNG